MTNELTSAEAFAKTVRDSHGWPEASISDADCCECEHSSWLAWGRAWTAATQAKNAEIAALRKELGNAKGLICEVYSLLPPLTPATNLIERKTGNWFAFGVDRNKAQAVQP